MSKPWKCVHGCTDCAESERCIDHGECEYACPVCGEVDDMQNYDCLGAHPNCVWCNYCGAHIDSYTGELVQVPVIET